MGGVEFRVLGPLEVVVGDGRLVLGGHKQRAVLALLLLHANELVSADRIIDAVWGEEPPPSASHAVQVYISQLRQLLASVKGPGIAREAAGYRLELPREALDLCRFEDLIAEGREHLAAQRARDARERLDLALDLWRASPFAEFAYNEFARAEIERLEDLRITANEYRADARLALGDHAEVVDDLYGLIARFPLREKLREQLMLALYRGGRQADALHVYSETREVLSEELGIEPNPSIQRLHQQVLQQSPDLDIEISDRSRDDEAPSVPVDAVRPGGTLELPTQTVQEMRTVTVVMAAISVPTQPFDAERLDLLYRQVFELMSSVAVPLGALVDVATSERFTAVFGFPQVHEDDAARAIAAATEIRDRLSRSPHLEHRYGFAPTPRIGVETGEVISPLEGQGFLFTGAPFTRAAELLWKARPGEILIGERARGSAELEFACEPHDASSGGDRIWRVGPRRARPGSRAGGTRDIALVGRVRELEILRGMYEASAEDLPPQIVHIVGEAGVGKTRLVEDFLNEVALDAVPPLVLNGRCLPYGKGITFWPLREAVWDLAGIGLDDPGPDAVRKLTRLVVRYLPDEGAERDRVLNTLAITAGIPIPGASFDGLSPETVGEEMSLGWPSFVSALAADRPVILVLEDLHWAEDLLLEMLQHIRLRSLGKALILTTTRPEPADATARPVASGGIQLRLAPLSRHENRIFLERLIPNADEQLRDRLAELGDGNAFFMHELVRRLLDEGAIEEGGQLLRGGNAADLPLPDTIRDLLAARLDALPEPEKRTLQEASVVGRVFWPSLIQRMQPELDVARQLQGLESRGFIVLRTRSSLPGDKEFAFSHALARETAYRSIPPSRRARAHALVADFIEERSVDQRAAFIEVIAHHYATAAAPDAVKLAWPVEPEAQERIRSKAVSALLESGRVARSRYAIDASIGFFDRAATLAASDEELFAVSEERAVSAHAAVRTDLAWAAYREAVGIARRMGDRAKELRMTAAAGLLCARFGGAFTTSEWRSELPQMISAALSESFEGEARPSDIAALLVGRAGLAVWHVSEVRPEEALEDVKQAVRVAESLDSPSLLAHALDVLRSLVLGREGFCRSRGIAARMVDVSAGIVDSIDSHELLVEATDAYCEAGSFEDAETTASAASSAAAGLSPHHKLHAASAQVSLLYPQGRMKELLHATKDAIEIVLDEDGQTCMRGEFAIFGCALALAEGGRDSEAEEVLQLVSTALSPPSSAAAFYLRGAEMLRPLKGLDRTAEEISRIKSIGIASEIWLLRAELPVLALTGDGVGVRDRAARARELATSACAPALAPIAELAEAIVLARRGSPDEAVEKAGHARTALFDLGEPYPAARLVVDLIPFLAPRDARRLSRATIGPLDELGSNATLAALRG